MEEQSKKIKIRQTGSSLRRNKKQSLYLKSIGLGKINQTRELIDSPSVRGVLSKLPHLVQVVTD